MLKSPRVVADVWEGRILVNSLFYGDNLDVLRSEIADESVDLVYLDPPFNSNANYNVLFKGPTGKGGAAQIEAFEDTWHWGDHAEDAFDRVMHSGNTDAADLLRALRGFLGESDVMAYLAMMAVRLLELRRVLKPNGSIWLHCDPTSSHYLKILLDGIFGASNFRNEIIWKRQSAHSDAKTKFPSVNDSILYYAKTKSAPFHPRFAAHDPAYLEKFYRFDDNDDRGRYRLGDMAAPKGGGMAAINKKTGKPNGWHVYKGYQPPATGWRYSPETMAKLDREGRIHFPKHKDGTPDLTKRLALKRYLAEQEGSIVTNVWTDIPPVAGHNGGEYLGYPTQKPLTLLERIIGAASNEGETVLDPFCGCGTAVHAAHKLGRNWIGIDITHLAISLIERRMKDAFPGISFEVHGTPKDLDSARDLAQRDKYQFQWWAVSLVNAQPYGGKKKGADGGIDGKVFFKPDGKRTEVAIVSVKGGDNLNVGMVRDLRAVIEREKAPIGLFICLAPTTAPMRAEAAKAGFYESMWGKHPRLQLLTIEELLSGKRPNMPLVDVQAAFKAAPRERRKAGDQKELAL